MKGLSDEEARIWHAWKRASDTVRARVAEEIGAATGLSDPDFGILTRLEDLGDGTLRQSELAASMGWHRSRLSHQLTRMEERGLVLRDAAAGPGVTVSLTPAGSAAVAAARPVHAEAVRRHLVSRIPSAELARLTEVLERLGDAST
ncbi:MarR family winged helix-turn-helix transcriptional regulator [Gryllotalpicola kribbensis]|uniref:MarR family winged helix-turn-helix transcriptional regulator n=1 Tax=Gryllotalpicola kribbensis TaxID=993084 RepID=A0ABP8ASX1_9MICO